MYDDNDLSGKLVWVTSVCEGCRWSLLIPCSWLYTFPGQPNLYLGQGSKFFQFFCRHRHGTAHLKFACRGTARHKFRRLILNLTYFVFIERSDKSM